MKYFIFYIAVNLIFSYDLVQAKGAPKTAQRKDVYVSSAWNGKDSFQFTYTTDTLSKTTLALKAINNNTWDNLYKYTNQYSPTKKIVEQIRENWNGSTWVNFTQYQYTYDANDNQTEVLYRSWNGTAWVNVGKLEYTGYNPQGNFTKEQTYNWNGSAWNNVSYNTAFYLIDGKKLNYKEYYFWNNTLGWVKDERLAYSYNQDSISSISQYKPDIQQTWTNYRKYLYTYNSSPFRLTQYKMQTTKKDTNNILQWFDSTRTNYAYNTVGLLENSLTEKFDSAILWQPKSRNEFIYNTTNELIETFEESYTGSWSNASKKTFQYTNGNLIEEMQYNGSGSTWSLSKKINYLYNAQNDVTFKQQELYSGSFVPDYREFYYYDNDITSSYNIDKIINQVTIYPNPTSNSALLSFNSNSIFIAYIRIIDTKGTSLTTIQTPVNQGLQHIQLPLERFANGQYFIQLKSSLSNQHITKTILISK